MSNENTIDELMRRKATEWKGPKDPDLAILINYMRADRMKADTGRKAKRSEVAEQVDPELWEIVSKGRNIQKTKAFRRF
jgi:hypothetical protein